MINGNLFVQYTFRRMVSTNSIKVFGKLSYIRFIAIVNASYYNKRKATEHHHLCYKNGSL